MAEKIKELARKKLPVSAEVLEMANRSDLSRYVAAKLLWDPFADTTYLIDEFVEDVDAEQD